jgi:ketosteroid isomerase-like protein
MQIHFDAKMKDGKSQSLTLRQLDAFKKIDGQWRIIQQHISFPADPKTGMTVMDGPFAVRGPVKWSSNPLPGPGVSPSQAKQEIRKWMDVGATSKGIDQLMGYYGPGDDVLVFDLFYPGELRGKAEVRANYEPMMGAYDGVKVKMPEFAVDSDGSFGVQIDTQDIEMTMKDGSKKQLSFRQSDCLRRVGGKWYALFEMISFPMDPKTGKAVMENPGAFK